MNDKIYFGAGDIVELKQDIPNKPKMVVKSVDKAIIRDVTNSAKSGLLGVTCIWFDKNMVLRSFRFNTKDLTHEEL